MAEPTPIRPLCPDDLLDVLTKHLSILNSHLQFLHTFSHVSDETPHTTNHASTSSADTIEQMIEQATHAIRNTERCSKLYRNKSPNNSEESKASSPQTTLSHRDKRPLVSLTTADDDQHKPAKRRRSSGAHKNVHETWHDAREHVAAAASTSTSTSSISSAAINPHVEYDDISAEVEARLLAREQRRKLRHSHQHSDSPYNAVTTKRKRRSTPGDSILGTMDVNGDRHSDRDLRISAGGTRQIKKLKTRKSNEGSRKSVLPLKSVRLPAEGEGKMEEAMQRERESANEVAKKRRRSSFVRDQAGEVVTNRFEADDRSTKRRKR